MSEHGHGHAFTFMNPRVREGVVVHGRRSLLKASLAGLGGLTLPGLMKLRAEASAATSGKSVILVWMTGGPSHIDTWDPDTHGDNIPPYGGIWNGLRPLLPVFDHVITTLVSDLHERGMLDIEERPVTPGDLAATICHHMGVPLDATYPDHQGRPVYIVDQGAPLKEIV